MNHGLSFAGTWRKPERVLDDVRPSDQRANNGMQRTALRAAADAERYTRPCAIRSHVFSDSSENDRIVGLPAPPPTSYARLACDAERIRLPR